jgi:hypothetical protein
VHVNARKVISQLCWLVALGLSRTTWHAAGGGVAGGFAVAGVIVAGFVAAGLVWPHQQRVGKAEGEHRQQLLARLATDLHQVAESRAREHAGQRE